MRVCINLYTTFRYVYHKHKELPFPLKSQNYTGTYCFALEVFTAVKIQMAVLKIMIYFARYMGKHVEE
jgi:hypothetical protein